MGLMCISSDSYLNNTRSRLKRLGDDSNKTLFFTSRMDSGKVEKLAKLVANLLEIGCDQLDINNFLMGKIPSWRMFRDDNIPSNTTVEQHKNKFEDYLQDSGLLQDDINHWFYGDKVKYINESIAQIFSTLFGGSRFGIWFENEDKATQKFKFVLEEIKLQFAKLQKNGLPNNLQQDGSFGVESNFVVNTDSENTDGVRLTEVVKYSGTSPHISDSEINTDSGDHTIIVDSDSDAFDLKTLEITAEIIPPPIYDFMKSYNSPEVVDKFNQSSITCCWWDLSAKATVSDLHTHNRLGIPLRSPSTGKIAFQDPNLIRADKDPIKSKRLNGIFHRFYSVTKDELDEMDTFKLNSEELKHDALVVELLINLTQTLTHHAQIIPFEGGVESGLPVIKLFKMFNTVEFDYFFNSNLSFIDIKKSIPTVDGVYQTNDGIFVQVRDGKINPEFKLKNHRTLPKWKNNQLLQPLDVEGLFRGYVRKPRILEDGTAQRAVQYQVEHKGKKSHIVTFFDEFKLERHETATSNVKLKIVRTHVEYSNQNDINSQYSKPHPQRTTTLPLN